MFKGIQKELFAKVVGCLHVVHDSYVVILIFHELSIWIKLLLNSLM